MKPRFLYGLVALTILLFSSPAQAAISAIDHQLSLHLDPKARTLEVSDRMSLQGSGEAIFQLAASMVITAIKVDGHPAALYRQGDTLRINLGSATEHVIELQYKGLLSRLTDRAAGFGSAPLIASQSGSYLASGSAWHPIVQGVAATYQVTMTLPAPQMAVVPGRLIQEASVGGQYHAVFKSEIPAEGIVLIAGAFIVDELRHGDIVLRTYFTPALENLSRDYLQSTAEYIDLYKKAIGDYPFSSFFIVSGPLPVGLGFAGMTYMGERVLALPFIRFTSLGHEVLHNWWGNAVEVDYENGNWAEGLTTFMADYAFDKSREQDKGKKMRTGWLRDYAALPPRRDHAVRSFISRQHDAAQIIGYNKVAYIFHMLERKIGKQYFSQGIQNFWTRHKFTTAGWAEIQAAFEQVSGQNLNVFFTQWLDRSGAARLVLSDIERSQDRVAFTLSQPDLPYSLEVPIRLVTIDGEEMFQASIDGAASRIDLPLSARPLSLAVDPDFELFRRLHASEAPPILRDATLNEQTVVLYVGADPEMQGTSRQLAARMLDGPPRFAGNSKAPPLKGPLMIIGTSAAVSQYLNERNLPSTPSSLIGRGSARVWAWRWANSEGNQQPLLVVEATDNQALQSLLGPLPHYGRRGYLIFEGAKVIDDGIWPTAKGPLTVTFD
ncbi:MAG: M1 family peptidase [Rhodospirillales bacterium]|nr:M1 family peptidase [Rhodospirillales bacterium]